MVVGLTNSVFDVPVNDECVARTFTESCAQVFPAGPVYHLTV